MAAAKPTVSDGDVLPSRLDATAQCSLVTAARAKISRSIQWSGGKSWAVAARSSTAPAVTMVIYAARAGESEAVPALADGWLMVPRSLRG